MTTPTVTETTTYQPPPGTTSSSRWPDFRFGELVHDP
jgi:hypothetical protein